MAESRIFPDSPARCEYEGTAAETPEPDAFESCDG